MRLLILTQKVNKNDPILGFFHRWIEEFSKVCESVIVICLEKGEYDLPANVRVFSLGKEEGKSRLKYLIRFYSYIWRERRNYDTVFVHMNQIYVILGAFLWRSWGKKVGLWYTHKEVSSSLRLAEKLIDVIFTASKESFRLRSKKVQVMGHGIDTDLFRPVENKLPKDKKTIVTTGRISRTKNLHVMVEAFAKVDIPNIEFLIVGEPTTPEEKQYKKELDTLIKDLNAQDRVKFVGKKTQREVAELLRGADLFLNLSNTGSLDKAVLEAMACNLYVVTSNEAFMNLADVYFKNVSEKSLTEIFNKVIRKDLGSNKREYIRKEHDLYTLILKIIKSYKT